MTAGTNGVSVSYLRAPDRQPVGAHSLFSCLIVLNSPRPRLLQRRIPRLLQADSRNPQPPVVVRRARLPVYVAMATHVDLATPSAHLESE